VPLPAQDPSESVLDWAYARFEAGERRQELQQLPPDIRRINEWIIAAEALALAEYRLPERLPGFFSLFVGLQAGPEDQSIVALAFVREQAPSPEGQIPLNLEVPGTESTELIPVIVPEWDLVLHQSPDAAFGTRTCFVAGVGQAAFLTARHVVVRTSLGSFVHLDDGTTAPLLRHAPECLDASIVAAPGAGHAPLSTSRPAAQTWVSVRTKSGGQSRQIDQLSHSFGTTTAAVPHLFTLDRPLKPGDSGSLVVDQRSGAGVGLYVGELKTPGGPVGLCQGLFQLETLFSPAGKVVRFRV
jgi:hypothetical protein